MLVLDRAWLTGHLIFYIYRDISVAWLFYFFGLLTYGAKPSSFER